MNKVGLVLEGGGMRGAYTAGALAWLIDNQIHFDYHVGISSGAVYLTSFLLNDKETAYQTAVHYPTDPKVVGLKAFMHEGHYVSYHHIFDHYLKEVEQYDITPLIKMDPIMEAGLYEMEKGETIWVNNQQLDPDLDLLRAACALPIASEVVVYNGKHYLDGGITKMIPIERSIEQGCNKHFVITTKPEGFVRKPANPFVKFLMRIAYKNFPCVLRDYKVRHLNYYKQIQIIEDLVKQKDAVLLRPSQTIAISRFKGDEEGLQKLYELGYSDMETHKDELLALFD